MSGMEESKHGGDEEDSESSDASFDEDKDEDEFIEAPLPPRRWRRGESRRVLKNQVVLLL